jgi:hypothetical protein
MDETELAKPVIQWLSEQHWEIYQEVQFGYGGGVADIVAVRNGILWIIETKTSYSFAVLNQASRWGAHYRSVAVPSARERDYRVALWYYQVGVIEVNFYKSGNTTETEVDEHIPAPLMRSNHKQSKRYMDSLVELQKTYAAAGSQSGHHLTPYKNTMIEVKRTISANPGCTIKDLFEKHGRMHYSSASSLKGNLIKALADFEKDWCRIDTSTKPYKLFIKESA